MFKWLKRAINANRQDLLGAMKGMRRMHRKMIFLKAEIYYRDAKIEQLKRDIQWWRERHADAVSEGGGVREGVGVPVQDGGVLQLEIGREPRAV